MLLGCLFAFSAFTQTTPGSLYVSLSVPSVSNLVGLMATILPGYIINNKTIDYEFKQSGFLYSINFHSIHVNTLNINQREITFVPGTKRVRLHLGDINVDSLLDGSMTFVGFIPLYAASLKIKGLLVQADLEAIPMGDQVHWQLTQATIVDLDDVTIETTSSVWNAMISPFHNTIKDMIKGQLPKISGAIQGVVDNLNAKLRLGGNNFMTDIFDPRFPLNLTTTQPPTADNQTKLVTLNFDGTFYDTIKKTTHVSANTLSPLRLKNMNSNQFFIHQSMISSLLIALVQDNMPLDITDANTTSQILMLFPEIQEHYGDSVQTELEIDITGQSGDVLQINQLTGMEIGKGADKLATSLIVKCKNNEMKDFETAVKFDFGLEGIANITIDSKWKLYLNIPNIAITSVLISEDKVGMKARRYDNLLTSVARSAINNVNAQWGKPFDITSLEPQVLPFLSNMLINLHVSPFYQNQFYYVGFTYFMDPAPQTMASYNHMTNELRDKHGDKIVKMLDIANAWYYNN